MDNINKATQEIDLPNIGKPATRALTNAGYINLAQLTQVTELEILKLHGVGPKAVRILNEALKEKQLSFAKNS
ncbi:MULTISPECIES: DNA-binding protein [Metabacillus]|uniref:DNA-binding protein n=3 Tax=Metabacillus TaxID=2675233 RepID=A0A179SM77_9BACI|nr:MULTISPECIES: DNA-binding protein [Metabacillus]OAS82757.1 DNA-binding protein [Metabacillus litoralis]QNF30198.1 DNA-binding protein [Metabacillus sp. KUDC1714]